uniref:Putative secreted protein n=1 Tax=Anopheles triannulatus TaxID=58253 RepID=A0A2M4B4C0_9DIPT
MMIAIAPVVKMIVPIVIIAIRVEGPLPGTVVALPLRKMAPSSPVMEPAIVAVTTPRTTTTTIPGIPRVNYRWRVRGTLAVRHELLVEIREPVRVLMLTLVQKRLLLGGQYVNVSLWIDHRCPC